MAVPAHQLHKDIGRGDHMADKQKYDDTYQLGNTTVHIVAPPPMSEEQIEKVLNNFHKAGWAIFDSLQERKKKLAPGSGAGGRGF